MVFPPREILCRSVLETIFCLGTVLPTIITFELNTRLITITLVPPKVFLAWGNMYYMKTMQFTFHPFPKHFPTLSQSVL